MLDAKLSWGDWWLNLDNLSLEFGLAAEPYYVDLERLTSSAEVLDAVVHVGRKAWGTSAVVGSLLKAIDDVLPLQENLCGGGKSRGLSRAAVAPLVARRAAQIPRERASEQRQAGKMVPAKDFLGDD